ncbi:MAG: multiheme c-type cytochrome [Gammaproteobacteria bacterium]|nr:multiheme c-type cytochrome [Gammaproteobacteria bacterium]MDH5654053.1 multiheme c-type cytochrome [Gammaproteobacteria bacterium]
MQQKIFFILLLCSLVPVAFTAAAEDNPVTIVYTGNLDGELEPCGCSKEGDLGGIRRRATILTRLRETYPHLLLVSTGGLLAADYSTDTIKNKYILQGIAQMHYDAIAVQPQDLSFGSQLLADTPLPWVSRYEKAKPFRYSRRIQRNNLHLHIFSWMSIPPQATGMHAADKQTQILDNTTLLTRMHTAKQQGDLVILATDSLLADITKQLKLTDVDILLIKSRHEQFGEPQKVGHTLVLQPGSRGMRLGLLRLSLDHTSRIRAFQHEVIPLPPSIPDSPAYAQWYKDYNEEIKQDYLRRVELRKASESGVSPYAGAEKCRTCHATAWQVWQQSRHARAFKSLRRVNKAFDPNCIGCHVVGFEKPGGYIDDLITEHLTQVQCESCHGAAGQHVKSGGTTPVAQKGRLTEKVCRQCHRGSHSPSFSLEKYWPKVAH